MFSADAFFYLFFCLVFPFLCVITIEILAHRSPEKVEQRSATFRFFLLLILISSLFRSSVIFAHICDNRYILTFLHYFLRMSSFVLQIGISKPCLLNPFSLYGKRISF